MSYRPRAMYRRMPDRHIARDHGEISRETGYTVGSVRTIISATRNA
jgi:hypothetical protein